MQFNPKVLVFTALSLAILWAAINWQSSVLGIVVGGFLSFGFWMYFTEEWPARLKIRNFLKHK